MSACQTCGACCAAYRVQFSVCEIDEAGGTVPAALTEPVNGSSWRMRGTGEVPIRCIALTGALGVSVGCSIYALRPSPCHDLTEGRYACNKARVRHGLPALGEWPGD
jgi:Fe-S-cluster containining protein